MQSRLSSFAEQRAVTRLELISLADGRGWEDVWTSVSVVWKQSLPSGDYNTEDTFNLQSSHLTRQQIKHRL